ncbi:hypothetical protein OUZ56_011854 [Daphnia magna]|uniref:Uncharacterized protein n=1 Tax=Daphnia magna TaxID=35525 RepID=A0ABQ9Z1B1_9CRUS|nr:hypothetical protein OUZ56_011854 [Daphnia magna]
MYRSRRKLSDYAKGLIHKEKEIYLEKRLLLVLQLAREDKYRRSEFSLGNSASDLGLFSMFDHQNSSELQDTCNFNDFDLVNLLYCARIHIEINVQKAKKICLYAPLTRQTFHR